MCDKLKERQRTHKLYYDEQTRLLPDLQSESECKEGKLGSQLLLKKSRSYQEPKLFAHLHKEVCTNAIFSGRQAQKRMVSWQTSQRQFQKCSFLKDRMNTQRLRCMTINNKLPLTRPQLGLGDRSKFQRDIWTEWIWTLCLKCSMFKLKGGCNACVMYAWTLGGPKYRFGRSHAWDV